MHIDSLQILQHGDSQSSHSMLLSLLLIEVITGKLVVMISASKSTR